jgi:uncharacterized protein YciI
MLPRFYLAASATVLRMARCTFASLFLIALCTAAPGFTLAQAQTPATAPQTSPAQVGKLQQFFIRLIPLRPNFASSMKPDEKAIMEAHEAYWADQFHTGKVLLAGPVLDPKGNFSMTVVECANRSEAFSLAENDPSVRMGINRVEVIPMHVLLRKQEANDAAALVR